MNAKLLALGFSVILTVAGCSKGEEEKTEGTKQELQQKTTEVSQNTELTKKIKDEDGVKDGKVYEQNGKAIGSIEVDQKVSDKEVKKLAEKYLEELKINYKNKDVNVKVFRDGKELVNIKNNNNSDNSPKGNKVVAVESLLKEKVITFKNNPVSKQTSVLLDSSKFTGVLKGKTTNELELVVGKETFNFTINPFKETLFEVLNTNFTEVQLNNAQIQVK